MMRSMPHLQGCVPAVLAKLLNCQPHSSAKVLFAWRAAVGNAISRATKINLTPRGTLEVRTTSQHWRKELQRSKPVILGRLQAMLGHRRVTHLTVTAHVEDRPRRRHTSTTSAMPHLDDS